MLSIRLRCPVRFVGQRRFSAARRTNPTPSLRAVLPCSACPTCRRFEDYRLPESGLGRRSFRADLYNRRGEGLPTGLGGDVNRIEGPILRGLAAGAPCFHNSAAQSLTELVNLYNRGKAGLKSRGRPFSFSGWPAD